MATREAIAKAPLSVDVGSFTYSISFNAEEAFEWSRFGTCHHQTRRIMLSPMQADTEIPHTLLHEILHAIGCVYEIGWLRDHWDDEKPHKDKTDLLTTALLEVWRRNPEVREFLAACAS